MGPLGEVLIAIPIVGAATTGSVALSMRSRLHRSLRLVPGRRVDVPWRWRWSPRRAPLLHRRLQRSCQVVLAATGPAVGRPPRTRRRGRRRRGEQETSILETTGRVLIDQAISIDLRLIAADRGGPAWRRLHLPALRSEIAALEASCLRLAQLSRAFDDHLGAATSRGPTAEPERAELLLDAMEEAIGELRREEQTAEK
jgi:hypothetical protein